ncbi:MAG: helix-hairpin-helix domain-containing protein [Oscillospiraceae bacterium]
MVDLDFRNHSTAKSIDEIKESDKRAILKDFQKIPGVGKSISQDLYDLGYRSIEELKNLDPEEMYKNLCAYQDMHVDRCMLYVFRCAVYYASSDIHDPELLKWWNWKDDK